MHELFDLGDAVIRDLPHVRVTRHAPRDGRACEYRKQFKPDGLGEAGYWIQRENDFLLDFTVKRLRHTVELSAFAQGGGGHEAPVVEQVATRDAGLTVESWLRVQPRYANGVVSQHPFQHAGLFLHLLRACLVALQEIHALGIVHCDIKEDNLCLPYSPYPYAAGQAVRLDFERARLIDFAFSVTPERPLRHPLPILPAAPYQSNLLKAALSADRGGKGRRLAAQQLDFRADLYSLGYCAGRLLEGGLLQPAGNAGAAALAGARRLVERLKAFDTSKRRGKTLPHAELIADIDALLADLTDVETYRRFEVAQVRAAQTCGDEAASDATGRRPTPLTPLATPLAVSPTEEYAQAKRETPPAGRTPRRIPRWLAPLLALTALVGYWQTTQPPAPASTNVKPTPKAELPPAADGEAEKRGKREAQWKRDADTQFQLEEAKAKKAKEKEQARAKAELAAELRAEAEAKAARAQPPPAPSAADEADKTEAPAPTKPAASANQTPPAAKPATASISHPRPGDDVKRAETIQGTLQGVDANRHAFLLIRSKTFGRLYYPQGELPRATEWALKGIYGSANYDYETFVVATDNPQSAELLRSPQSRAHGLQSLPEDTRVISGIVTVRRVE